MPSPCCAVHAVLAAMQVDSSQAIAVGRWVRLFAVKPLSVSRRALLHADPPAAEPLRVRLQVQPFEGGGSDSVQPGREKVIVQVQPWKQETLQDGGATLQPEQQKPARRLLADTNSSSGTDGVQQPLLCGKPGARQRCRQVTEAMWEWKREAEALGLDQPEDASEAEGSSVGAAATDDGSGEQATAASAQGTMDAYMYGENAVDSGSGE